MKKIDFSPENISALFQKAVDEAIEQHRINGESIAIGENGKVLERHLEKKQNYNSRLKLQV